VAGLFLDDYIPSNKLWMTKYFTTSVQRRFLIYFLIFGSHFYFIRHTGVYCTSRYLKKMKKNFCNLQKAHDDAKKNFDLDKLAEIEMGNFKL